MPRLERRTLALVAVGVLIGGAFVVGSLASRSPAGARFAFYRTGQATLTIDGVLGKALPLIEQGATFISPHGAALIWRSPDGWYLNVNGPFDVDPATPTEDPTPGSEPSVERIDANGSLQFDGADPRRWAGLDPTACAIDYDEVTARRIAGTVHCRGLIWYDGSSVEHVRPVDAPPFDLDVAFEARGDGKLPETSPS